jgi:hypothetical protein
MEGLNKSVSTVTQLWKPINLSTPEDGDDTFSETSVLITATRYKVPGGILNYLLVLLLHAVTVFPYKVTEQSLKSWLVACLDNKFCKVFLQGSAVSSPLPQQPQQNPF